jgi:hypothetical protein
VWLNGGKCMTVGFGKQAQREIKTWDTRCLAVPLPALENCNNLRFRYLDDALNSQELDQSASVMMPYAPPLKSHSFSV